MLCLGYTTEKANSISIPLVEELIEYRHIDRGVVINTHMIVSNKEQTKQSIGVWHRGHVDNLSIQPITKESSFIKLDNQRQLIKKGDETHVIVPNLPSGSLVKAKVYNSLTIKDVVKETPGTALPERIDKSWRPFSYFEIGPFEEPGEYAFELQTVIGKFTSRRVLREDFVAGDYNFNISSFNEGSTRVQNLDLPRIRELSNGLPTYNGFEYLFFNKYIDHLTEPKIYSLIAVNAVNNFPIKCVSRGTEFQFVDITDKLDGSGFRKNSFKWLLGLKNPHSLNASFSIPMPKQERISRWRALRHIKGGR